MRWTLVAVVVSCAHDEMPAKVQPEAARAVVVVVDASAAEMVDAFEAATPDVFVRDAAAEREAWRAKVDALPLPNVDHVTLSPPGASSGVQTPSVRVADVRTTDGFEPLVARRIVRANITRVRYCYERSLQSSPNLDKLVVTFRVAAVSGDVVYAGLVQTNAPRELAECVAGSFATIGMPALPGLTAFEATIHLDQPPPAPRSPTGIGPR